MSPCRASSTESETDTTCRLWKRSLFTLWWFVLDCDEKSFINAFECQNHIFVFVFLFSETCQKCDVWKLVRRPRHSSVGTPRRSKFSLTELLMPIQWVFKGFSSELRVVSLQEPQVVLGCVQLLQSLSQHKQHLKDLPSKTMMDILTEVTSASDSRLYSSTRAARTLAHMSPPSDPRGGVWGGPAGGSAGGPEISL